MIRITLRKGTNQEKPNHIANIKALGLRKIGSSVEMNDTPQIRGMIKKVQHLVKVEEIGEVQA
ncbi:MAG: 50S ribosomal protein L30 [Eubacteriales bacterium]|nr:50S ribosomal protein L30 [Eubacteriales bacterium]